jgi:hypothetical protein
VVACLIALISPSGALSHLVRNAILSYKMSKKECSVSLAESPLLTLATRAAGGLHRAFCTCVYPDIGTSVSSTTDGRARMALKEVPHAHYPF